MKTSFACAISALALGLAAPALAQDAFPVTIPHFFGETVIEGPSERIVTISWMSQDTVIALGLTPVAISSQAWGGDEEGYLPWVREAVEARGDALPVTLTSGEELPFEQILTLDPDIILAPYSGLSEEDYNRLSAIAPTVAYRDGPWTGRWQDVVETVGAALGMSEEAAALLDQTQAHLASYRETYPQIVGATFMFGTAPGDANAFGTYIPADPRVSLMADLGLVPAAALHDLPTDNFTQPVSFETLDSIDADVLVAWHSSQDDVDQLLANPLFARFGPVAAGRYIPIIDRASVMALSAPSPLSVPWIMDRFVPELAAALAR